MQAVQLTPSPEALIACCLRPRPSIDHYRRAYRCPGEEPLHRPQRYLYAAVRACFPGAIWIVMPNIRSRSIVVARAIIMQEKIRPQKPQGVVDMDWGIIKRAARRPFRVKRY